MLFMIISTTGIILMKETSHLCFEQEIVKDLVTKIYIA